MSLLTSIVLPALVGLLLGLLILEAYIYLLGRDIPLGRGVGSRIMVTIAQLVNEGSNLHYRADGTYTWRRMQRNPDLESGWEAIDPDGTTTPIQNSRAIGRLGKKPISITYEKTAAMFDDVTVEDYDETDVLAQLKDAVVLDRQRGGYHVYRQHLVDAVEGFQISLSKVDQRLRSAASPWMADVAKDRAMEKFGGDTSDMSTMWVAVGGVLAAICGAGIALVAM